MVDIVDLLRDRRFDSDTLLMFQAASEIERLRAQLAAPEPLPEDVEALATKMAAMINTSIWPVEKWNSLARLVLADRQRAVEAAVAEIQRRITREMDHADLHGMEDAALVDNIHGAVWNYVDEIRARGAAQEG